MTESIIIITYSILYFIAFAWIGGRYSSEMQDINKLNTLIKSDKFDYDKLSIQIKQSSIRIKKLIRVTLITFCLLLIVHLLLNLYTLNTTGYYYYIIISCFIFIILLIAVFMLKGSGTIDSNPRMHGGIRI
jgi:hypothetical protein